ncbi:spectrin beta chain, non-erythrocytic 1-like [Hypanus sabinus]|uniref:spectrin beta chain, non-erythrocytic 1-like n=1 Tax=Hypanus sabinus TaxID=79690 RepID=UPI0028C4B928|nr:spectrin beta chain, non-erythrocytic 1-like [Hypanus sabinus]
MEEMRRELEAIRGEVERIGEEARKLAQIHPHIRENLQERVEEVAISWSNLHQKAREWKEKLIEAEQIQAYVSDCRVFMSWVNEMDTLLDTEEQARGSVSADQLYKRHKEYKREIDKQKAKYEELLTTGTELRENRHILSKEVDEKLNEMSEQMNQVMKKWEIQEALYEEELWKQAQLRELELMAAWLGSKEGLISGNNFGDSVSEVEDLIKKQEDFEKMLAAQDEKFGQLEKGERFQRNTSVKEKERKVAQVPSLKRKGSDKKTTPLRIYGRTNSDTGKIPKSWPKEIVVSPAPRSPATSERFFSPGLRAVAPLKNLDVASDRRQTSIQSPLSPKSFALYGSEVDSPTKRLSNPTRHVQDIHKSLSNTPSRSSLEESPQDLTSPTRETESPTKSQSQSLLSNSPTSNVSEDRPEQHKSTKSSSVDPVPIRKVSESDPPESAESPSFLRGQIDPQQPDSTGQLNNDQDAAEFQTMEGTLCWKHILQSNGTKTDPKDWDTCFVTLAKQVLSFYANRTESLKDSPCSPSLSVSDATCGEAVDSTEEHTFQLRLSDGVEYLFSAPSDTLMDEWIEKISTSAGSSANGPSPSHSPRQSWETSPVKSLLSADASNKTGTSPTKMGNSKDFLPRRTPSFRVKQSASSKPLGRRDALVRPQSTNILPGTEMSRVHQTSGSAKDENLSSNPPPKPPHTYYNTHPYPEAGEQLKAGSSKTLGSTPDLRVEYRESSGSKNRELDDNRRKTWGSEQVEAASSTPALDQTQNMDAEGKKKRKNVFKGFFGKK